MDPMTDQDKVTITENRHVSYFNTQGQVVRVRRVSIFVGPYGPFSKDFPVGADSPAEVQTWIQNEKSAAIGLRNAV